MRKLASLLPLLVLVGCQAEKSSEKPKAPAQKFDALLAQKAEGMFDMQYNDRQISFFRTQPAGSKFPFSMLRVEKNGTFKLAIYRRDAKTQQFQGLLGEGKFETNDNEFTFISSIVNKKPVPTPVRLKYRLSSDGSAFVHADGTTFLRRSDPDVKAGNANIEEFLAKLKAEEVAKKKAVPQPKNR